MPDREPCLRNPGRRLRLLAAVSCLILLYAHSGPVFGVVETEKLAASDGGEGAWFGRWISVSGDRLLIGAPHDDEAGGSAGAAYIYELVGGSWSNETKLLAPDAVGGDIFGFHVDIDGDYAVVGASRNDDQGTYAGAAYIFHFDGANWTGVKILADDGEAEDRFGYAVAISGDAVLVGAFGDDDLGSQAGAAYVFRRSGSTWSQEAKLTASDGMADHQFGFSVDLSGDVAIIGRNYTDENTQPETAYIFRHDGQTWNEVAILQPGEAFPGAHFGYAVAIDGDGALVGAFLDTANGGASGSAFVFRDTGSEWIEEDKILPGDGNGSDYFGYAVELEGDLAVCGAYRDTEGGIRSGSAYLFRNSGLQWEQVAELLPSDGQDSDWFGMNVALGGGNVFAGAPQKDELVSNAGAVYTYSGLVPEDSYYFIHITDTHIDANPLASGATERLQLVLDHLRAMDPPPAFLVVSGDLVEVGDQNLCQNYQEFMSLFFGGAGQLYLDEDMTVPVYVAPGNHDYRWSLNLLCYDSELDYPNEVEHGYTQALGDVQIVSLDGGHDDPFSLIGDLWLPEGSGFSQAQIDWAAGVLGPGEPDVVFMHHPVVNCWEGVWNDGCIANRRQDFLNLCQNHQIGLVLCGHTHEGYVFEYTDGAENEVTGNFDGQEGEAHYYLTHDGPVSYGRTLNVQTPDTREGTSFRKIEVRGDELRIYAYRHGETTSSGTLEWEEGTSFKRGAGRQDAVARLHVWSGDLHLGEDGMGGLDADIPGGYYAPITWPDAGVFGVEASVLWPGDYLFAIEALQPGEVDFRWTHRREIPYGEISLDYENVALGETSFGRLTIAAGEIDPVLAIDDDGDEVPDRWLDPDHVTYRDTPLPPDQPTGPQQGQGGALYTYSTQTSDPEDDPVAFWFDWGDGTQTGWFGSFGPEEEATAQKEWAAEGEYLVRVRAKDSLGYISDWSEELVVSIGETGVAPGPLELHLLPAQPNPFNPSVTIGFALPAEQAVEVAVFGLDGRRVATLLRERLSAGPHEAVWDGRDGGGRTVASGVYICRLEAGTAVRARRMTLIR